MYPCEPVGLDFFDTAPFRSRHHAELPVSPQQLWEVLGDVEAWPQWFDAVTRARWTSPEPRGVGSTRIVEMRGGVLATEEFIAWKPPSHMAFRFIECSKDRTGASAEEYRIAPTRDGCELTWTVAQSPIDPPWLARKLAPRVMNSTYRRALDKLQRHLDRRYGLTI
jgi:uncharacterized protein YndB with AHSA1/START domain